MVTTAEHINQAIISALKNQLGEIVSESTKIGSRNQEGKQSPQQENTEVAEET